MFLLYLPNATLIASAIIPAIALMCAIYRLDRVEKEPTRLLISLAVSGIFATTIAKLLERLGMLALDELWRGAQAGYLALECFGIIGFAEEGAKYLLLKKRTWGIPDFDCSFDGVVYAASVSLGFALWENLGYVFSYGLGTALTRAITAVPGHCCFGVLMGAWYSQAYIRRRRGDETGSAALRALAVILPALLHGAYDYLAMSLRRLPEHWFALFVLGLFAFTYALARRLSQSDRYI